MKKIRNFKIVFTHLLSVSFLLISCSPKNKQHSNELDNHHPCISQSELKTFAPLKVENTPVIKELRLTGKVAYNPNKVLNYTSLVSGTIVSSHISLGDQVQKGQVLAEIKSKELSEMRAELIQLKADLKVAQREFESVQNFYHDHIASEKELIQARSEKEKIEAELDNLQSNLQLYPQGSERNLFQILAPQSGFIVKNRLVDSAQISAEGEPLFTLSDIREVWVNLNIHAANLRAVHQGMPIQIKTRSYPDQIFHGKIQHISNVVDPDENVIKARVVLENEALILKPGLSVEGLIKAETAFKMPRLPDSSVIYQNRDYYVVVIQDSCKIGLRKVEVFLSNENEHYIQKGIDPGEIVVTKKALLLSGELRQEDNYQAE